MFADHPLFLEGVFVAEARPFRILLRATAGLDAGTSRERLFADLAPAEGNRPSAVQQEAGAIARIEKARSELEGLQIRLEEAKATLVNAENLRGEIRSGTAARSQLEHEIAALQSTLRDLEGARDGGTARQNRLVAEIERL